VTDHHNVCLLYFDIHTKFSFRLHLDVQSTNALNDDASHNALHKLSPL